jgi:hypothetical protein
MPPENLMENQLRSTTLSQLQIDGLFDSMTGNASFIEDRTPAAAGLPPAVYKMRCPHCKKLYSVQAQVVLSASSPLHFQCKSCNVNFETPVLSMDEINHMEIETRFVRGEVGVGAPAGLVPCPKCHQSNERTAEECRSCGIVFAKYDEADRLDRLSEFGIRRDLADLWASTLNDYDNMDLHEQFIAECYKADCLSYAAQKYSRILGAAPNENIAKLMRRRILGLASFKTESPSVRKNESTDKTQESGFKIPRIDQLILIAGGALMGFGLILPNSKDLIGIGLATVALGAGIFYFRPKNNN